MTVRVPTPARGDFRPPTRAAPNPFAAFLSEPCAVPLHQPSGRWWLGLILTLVTVVLWATQPVALKVALAQIPPLTLVWVRFAGAGIALGGWLAWRGEFRPFRGLPGASWLLLGIAVLSLLGNFAFYMMGLQLTTPGNAQFLFQASHPLVALGAILVFKERFNRWQWCGMAAIGLGLALFFLDRRAGSLQADGHAYALGSALILLSALCWPGFALAQKQLLRNLSSTQIVGFVYLSLTVLFLPFGRPVALLAMDGAHWAAVGYCMMTTLVSYLAFAEAFEHWEASRVAVVCCATPILTVLAVGWTHHLAPALLSAERMTLASWAGGALIVSGSALSSLMRAREPVDELGSLVPSSGNSLNSRWSKS